MTESKDQNPGHAPDPTELEDMFKDDPDFLSAVQTSEQVLVCIESLDDQATAILSAWEKSGTGWDPVEHRKYEYLMNEITFLRQRYADTAVTSSVQEATPKESSAVRLGRAVGRLFKH